MKASDNIIDLPIEELSLSHPLKQIAATYGWRNLREMFSFRLVYLMKLPEFNYHLYHELLSFLIREDMLDNLRVN